MIPSVHKCSIQGDTCGLHVVFINTINFFNSYYTHIHSYTLTPPSNAIPQNVTLNEPVSTTLLRDLKAIGSKLKVVLLPFKRQEETIKELRNWDLWGPLLLCLALSIILSLTAPKDQSALVFAAVFVIVWCVGMYSGWIL